MEIKEYKSTIEITGISKIISQIDFICIMSFINTMFLAAILYKFITS